MAILRYQFFQKRLMTEQLPMARRAPLGFWLDRTRFLQLAVPSRTTVATENLSRAAAARPLNPSLMHSSNRA